MPFEVELKGWLQVSECLLCPETVLLPPGQLIRFEYDDPDVQHYYRIVAKYGTGDVNYVLSRQFSSLDNPLDGSQNISYKTGAREIAASRIRLSHASQVARPATCSVTRR